MESNKLETVMAALLTPAVPDKEEYKNDEDCGFVNADPDRVDSYGNERRDYDHAYYSDNEEDDDVDSVYEDWVGDTNSCYDEGRRIEDLARKLLNIAETIQDDNYRYYENEADRLEELADELDNLVDRIEESANDYSTFD